MGTEQTNLPKDSHPSTQNEIAILIMAAKSTASHWLAGNSSLLQHIRAKVNLHKFTTNKPNQK